MVTAGAYRREARMNGADEGMTDILILLDEKELDIFKKNIGWIKDRIPHGNVVVIGGKRLEKSVSDIDADVHFIDENTMLPGLCIGAVRKKIKEICGTGRRAGWYFQQFLKMGYALRCRDRYYLIWDSDTIPVRQTAFFDGGGLPYMDYRQAAPYDGQYFETISRLFPERAAKRANVSFVTEHMVIEGAVMRELIREIEENQTVKGRFFWEKIINAVGKEHLNLSGFSEFETYAFFVRSRYPHTYTMRRWKNLRNGKFYLGEHVTEKQLQWLTGFDAVSVEDFDVCGRLFTTVVERLRKKGIRFGDIYKVVNPFYDLAYRMMMNCRRVSRRYLTGKRGEA